MYIIILAVCIISPETATLAAKKSILLWASAVLPSLFPFFILSKALYFSGGIKLFSKIFKPVMRFLLIPEEYAFAFAVSLICGYPTGSRTVGQMMKNGLDDGDYAACLFCSSGPVFIIGTVGSGMLKSVTLGAALYCIHVCTLIILSCFLSPKQKSGAKVNTNIEGGMAQAVSESVLAILNVCGFMVFFGIINGFISPILPKNTALRGMLSGLIEFTGGLNILSCDSVNLPQMSFLLSFGGGCVISQCLACLKGINVCKFIFCRILSGCTAFLLCLIYIKTALFIPAAIALLAVAAKHIFRRKKLIC